MSQKAARKVSSPTPDLEESVVKALRLGDVRKALQLFVPAPIAPKGAATFQPSKLSTPKQRPLWSPPRHRPMLPPRLQMTE